MTTPVGGASGDGRIGADARSSSPPEGRRSSDEFWPPEAVRDASTNAGANPGGRLGAAASTTAATGGVSRPVTRYTSTRLNCRCPSSLPRMLRMVVRSLDDRSTVASTRARAVAWAVTARVRSA